MLQLRYEKYHSKGCQLVGANEEKTIHRQMIFEGKVISLRIEDVALPNGQIAKRELVAHPGAVAIVAITNEGHLIFVKQYRKALERTLIEIPAGKIEQGEAPEMTALRELEEETGYTTKDLTFIQSIATSPGFADEIIHLYVARQLIQVENPIAGDEDEFIDVITVPLEEAEEMIQTGDIIDAKTVVAIHLAKNMITS